MNLRNLAVAIKVLKETVANATDGLVIGVDTLSGGPYTGDLPAIGTILVINGRHKVVVDAIAYGDHYNGDNFYAGENRLVLVEFDPATLEITGKRTNASFKSVDKATNVGMIFDYVIKREEEIEAASEAAQKAAALAIRQAAAQVTKTNMNEF